MNPRAARLPDGYKRRWSSRISVRKDPAMAPSHGFRVVLILTGISTALGFHPQSEKAPPVTPAQRGQDRHGDPLPEGVLARFGTVRLRQANATVLGFSPD